VAHTKHHGAFIVYDRVQDDDDRPGVRSNAEVQAPVDAALKIREVEGVAVIRNVAWHCK
jgi:hypothetical protein